MDISESGLTFKMQLYSLTGVPPERQKILVKGGQLKDDTDLSTLNIKPNHPFMLLGSAEELPKPPVVKPLFAEDMTDQQMAQSTNSPNGLINVGNTCYANATLQALKTVPELTDALSSYNTPQAGLGLEPDLTGSLRDLYKKMGGTTSAYYPLAFINILRQAFPQFDERGNDGLYKQQDAEEAWSQILASMRGKLKTEAHDQFVEKYFGGEFETTLKCNETNEPAQIGKEKLLKLNCHISITTNFLRDGLLSGLEEKIEKFNDSLGRNAEYTLTKRITRLPKYLTVHYMRFFWRRDTQKKSKILRKVQFPFNYDATELCSEDLKKKLFPARDKFRELEKEKEELQRSAKRAKHRQEEDGDRSLSDGATISDEKLKQFNQQINELVDPELAKDTGCNVLGLYQLAAVVTHQGASADAGHYQCFAKNDQEEGKWWRFNDDKVSIVDDARIETLAGGGESDSALILLYRMESL